MTLITCVDQLQSLNHKIASRVSSGYGSDSENGISDLSSSLQASKIGSPQPLAVSQPAEIFYSDFEIDELAQRFETSIYRPGTYIYLDPSKTRVEAAEMFYFGAWPYEQTAQNNSKKLESCLFSCLDPRQAELFINLFNGSLAKNIGLFKGDAAKFNDALRKHFEFNLRELPHLQRNNNEIRNFMMVKAMRSAFMLSVPKENRNQAMDAFSRNFCSNFILAFLGRQSLNSDNKIVIDLPVTDKKRFVESNVKALLKGMEIIRNKYEPFIEGENGFFAKIATIIATMEKTSAVLKDAEVVDLLPRGFLQCDEGCEDPSDVSKTAEVHLKVLDSIYDSLLMLLKELNTDLDTFQRQREVMTDVHYANQRYNENGFASFPYLHCDSTIRINKADPGDADFHMFLDDFYNDVDNIYFSHMVYFRKTISAVENVRETLAGVIDRYQELIAFS